MERSFIAGSAVWNMFDFGAEDRADAIPHINQKGLCTFNRQPKDAHYIVKSQLSTEPIVKVLAPLWCSITGPGNEVDVPIDIIGNVSTVTITVNRNEVQKVRLNTSYTFNAKLHHGSNQIIVQGDAVSDSKTIRVIRSELSDSESFAMNAGAPFYFSDPASQTNWLPQIEYGSNTFGVTGGHNYRPRDRGIGTDKGIAGTDLDPLYQTSRVGIQLFRVTAVDTGNYTVMFHFAELEKEPGERVFDLYVNDKLAAKDLDVCKLVGKFNAFQFASDVHVDKSNPEINVDFRASKGVPILNAIQISKK
jgi:beta-galactosidase